MHIAQESEVLHHLGLLYVESEPSHFGTCPLHFSKLHSQVCSRTSVETVAFDVKSIAEYLRLHMELHCSSRVMQSSFQTRRTYSYVAVYSHLPVSRGITARSYVLCKELSRAGFPC